MCYDELHNVGTIVLMVLHCGYLSAGTFLALGGRALVQRAAARKLTFRLSVDWLVELSRVSRTVRVVLAGYLLCFPAEVVLTSLQVYNSNAGFLAIVLFVAATAIACIWIWHPSTPLKLAERNKWLRDDTEAEKKGRALDKEDEEDEAERVAADRTQLYKARIITINPHSKKDVVGHWQHDDAEDDTLSANAGDHDFEGGVANDLMPAEAVRTDASVSKALRHMSWRTDRFMSWVGASREAHPDIMHTVDYEGHHTHDGHPSPHGGNDDHDDSGDAPAAGRRSSAIGALLAGRKGAKWGKLKGAFGRAQGVPGRRSSAVQSMVQKSNPQAPLSIRDAVLTEALRVRTAALAEALSVNREAATEVARVRRHLADMSAHIAAGGGLTGVEMGQLREGGGATERAIALRCARTSTLNRRPATMSTRSVWPSHPKCPNPKVRKNVASPSRQKRKQRSWCTTS